MSNNKSLASTLVVFTLVALVFLILFFIVKGFILFIYKYAFIFLIISLIANYRVPLQYLTNTLNLLKREPLFGIGAIALTVIIYPLVFFIWMIKSLLGYVLPQNAFQGFGFPNQQQEKYAEYEEIEEMELREMEKHKR